MVADRSIIRDWSPCLSLRHSKPFNPLLGETFELVHKEHAYCLIAEQVSVTLPRCWHLATPFYLSHSDQVSHHPPVTAMHCESAKWIFWEEYNLDIKFRGQVGIVCDAWLGKDFD